MSFGVAPGSQRVNQRGAVLAFSQNGIKKATGLAFALFGRRSTISRAKIRGHLHLAVKNRNPARLKDPRVFDVRVFVLAPPSNVC